MRLILWRKREQGKYLSLRTQNPRWRMGSFRGPGRCMDTKLRRGILAAIGPSINLISEALRWVLPRLRAEKLLTRFLARFGYRAKVVYPALDSTRPCGPPQRTWTAGPTQARNADCCVGAHLSHAATLCRRGSTNDCDLSWLRRRFLRESSHILI